PLAERHLCRVGLVIVGPVNEQRLSDQTTAWCKTPKAAVVAVVSIVAHHEEGIGRNDRRRHVVAFVDLTTVGVHRLRFIQFARVDVDLSIPDFDGFSRKTDYALHQSRAWSLWRPERDDFATIYRSSR